MTQNLFCHRTVNPSYFQQAVTSCLYVLPLLKIMMMIIMIKRMIGDSQKGLPRLIILECDVMVFICNMQLYCMPPLNCFLFFFFLLRLQTRAHTTLHLHNNNIHAFILSDQNDHSQCVKRATLLIHLPMMMIMGQCKRLKAAVYHLRRFLWERCLLQIICLGVYCLLGFSHSFSFSSPLQPLFITYCK